MTSLRNPLTLTGLALALVAGAGLTYAFCGERRKTIRNPDDGETSLAQATDGAEPAAQIDPLVEAPVEVPLEAPVEAPVETPVETPILEVRKTQPEHPRRWLALPDGSWVKPLNGVTVPGPFEWPRHIPYSPIIGTTRGDKGLWWYMHADGARSTTSFVSRWVLGRSVAVTPVTQIYNPIETLPVEADARRTGKRRD